MFATAAAALWGARRYYRNWGATKEEGRAAMCGDGHVRDPAAQTTAGEWIDAHVDTVWPAVTNLLCAGQPEVGDVIRLPATVAGQDVFRIAMSVLEVEAGRVLVLRTVRTPIIPIDATLTVLVESRWVNRTRLLARLRIALRHPGDFAMAEALGPVLAALTRHALVRIRRAAEHVSVGAATPA